VTFKGFGIIQLKRRIGGNRRKRQERKLALFLEQLIKVIE
jgi:hypothetical protein